LWRRHCWWENPAIVTYSGWINAAGSNLASDERRWDTGVDESGFHHSSPERLLGIDIAEMIE